MVIILRSHVADSYDRPAETLFQNDNQQPTVNSHKHGSYIASLLTTHEPPPPPPSSKLDSETINCLIDVFTAYPNSDVMLNDKI